ncbi:hypothetical protein [Chryseobacterium bernardetii]|uniref:hypothetical protein n=1 Tax=Chryseobacterium bernardetii TaxID=1241978 RepID=UPI001E42CC8A|nr:hypothetical protein [Chryseobacterium bernardetii]
MEQIKRFFNEKNEVSKDADIDFSQDGEYLEAVKALARTTYQSLYVINYQTKGFEYVSENPLFYAEKPQQK